MDGTRDLQLLLAAFRSGEADSAVLAAAADWHPATDGPLGRFLADRGLLPDALADQLAATATTAVFPAPADLHDTPTQLPAVRDGIPTVPIPAADLPPPRVPPRPPARYQLLHTHDAGGLGEVWLARDTLIDRQVAIKTIRPDRPDTPAARARFVREGRVTGQLEHPCIVPLYDLDPGDPDAGGGPSYVMRFIDGETLYAAIKRYHDREATGPGGRLALVRLLDAFVAVCRAVGYAHSKGVMHRDLKGPNVILGAFGEVFLIDWGLAKRVGDPEVVSPDEWVSVPTGETPRGALIGTPPYMALELANGAEANPRTDIYALGVVLFHILTGKLPITGDTPQEVFQRLRASPLPPPAAVAKDTPPALDAVCCKAMAREPADRYQTAEALALDVRRWLADEPVTAYPEPWPVRAGRWAKRHRSKVIAAGVALATATVALGISTMVVWREMERTAEQKTLVTVEKNRAEANFVMARDVSRSALPIVEGAEPWIAAVPGLQSARKSLLDGASRAFRQYLTERPNDPDLKRETAQVLRFNATVHKLDGESILAERLYNESIGLREQLANEFPANKNHRDNLGLTLRDYADFRVTYRRVGEAADLLDQAARLAEEQVAVEPGNPAYRRTLALILSDRAKVEITRGRPDDARPPASRAIELFESVRAVPAREAHPYDPILLATAHTVRAVAHREAGRVGDAETDHAVALKYLIEFQTPLRPGVNPFDVQYQIAVARFEQAVSRARLPNPGNRGDESFRSVASECGRLARLFPTRPMYRVTQARALEALGRQIAGAEAGAEFDQARQVLEPVAAKCPDYVGAQATLGRAYIGLVRVARGGGGRNRRPAVGGGRGGHPRRGRRRRPGPSRGPGCPGEPRRRPAVVDQVGQAVNSPLLLSPPSHTTTTGRSVLSLGFVKVMVSMASVKNDWSSTLTKPPPPPPPPSYLQGDEKRTGRARACALILP